MIVVEFSLAQKAFHKQSLFEMITTNYRNIFGHIQTDYVPIAIFKTDDEADKFVADNQSLKEYSLYKSYSGEVIVK